MKLLRNHPLFCAIMAVILVVLGVQLWLVRSLGLRERLLEAEIGSRITEIERLQRQQPGPHEANVQAAQKDFNDNAKVLATMLQVLNVTGPEDLAYFEGEPSTRTDAFFDIASFVDRMRAAAEEAQIQISEDERFGFTIYTNEGPDPELIRPVYRQRRIVEYLLGNLFPARPRALISVQREDPANLLHLGEIDAPPPQPPAPRAGDGRDVVHDDYFVIDPQVSARTPGYVDTMAFKIVFAGQTSALRGFLNSLAAPEIPLVVRSVEVDRNEVQEERQVVRGRRGSRDNSSAQRAAVQTAEESPNVPIVAENISRFTVTVEMFVVKIRAPEPMEGES